MFLERNGKKHDKNIGLVQNSWEPNSLLTFTSQLKELTLSTKY